MEQSVAVFSSSSAEERVQLWDALTDTELQRWAGRATLLATIHSQWLVGSGESLTLYPISIDSASGNSGTTARRVAVPEPLFVLTTTSNEELIGGGASGNLFRWNATGALSSTTGHWGALTALATGPLGIISAGADATVRWWGAGERWELLGEWRRPALPVTALQWWRRRVVTVSRDRWLRVWAPRGQRGMGEALGTDSSDPMGSEEGPGVLLPATPSALAVAGDWAIVGMSDGSVGTVGLPAQAVRRWVGHRAAVTTVAVSGTILVSGAADGTVGVWRLSGGGLGVVGDSVSHDQESPTLQLQLLRLVKRHEGPVSSLLAYPLATLTAFNQGPPVFFQPPQKYPTEAVDPFSAVCEGITLEETGSTVDRVYRNGDPLLFAAQQSVSSMKDQDSATAESQTLKARVSMLEEENSQWREVNNDIYGFCVTQLLNKDT